LQKKESRSERRPITDAQQYNYSDPVKFSSMSKNLSNYENTKKMSKLFKKAGAGRFSHNIDGRAEGSTFSASSNVSYISYYFILGWQK
jgi:hypothetical protein